jgi:hypothetical protein
MFIVLVQVRKTGAVPSRIRIVGNSQTSYRRGAL